MQVKKEVPPLPTFTIEDENVATIILSKLVLEKINTLNKYIPNLEWSGITFFKYDKTNNVTEVVDLLPIDIGSATYTEFFMGEEIPKYIMKNKELLMCSKGKIHSHNTMPTFFSNEDMKDLYTMSEFHNCYFSMIVNNDLEMRGKFCSRKSIKVPFQFKTTTNEDINAEKEIVSYYITDCKFEYDKQELTPFEIEVQNLIAVHKEKKAKKITSYKGTYNFNKNTPSLYNQNRALYSYNQYYDNDDFSVPEKKVKTDSFELAKSYLDFCYGTITIKSCIDRLNNDFIKVSKDSKDEIEAVSFELDAFEDERASEGNPFEMIDLIRNLKVFLQSHNNRVGINNFINILKFLENGYNEI